MVVMCNSTTGETRKRGPFDILPKNPKNSSEKKRDLLLEERGLKLSGRLQASARRRLADAGASSQVGS